MVYRTEIGPVGNPDVTLTGSDTISVDIAKPHTALADFDTEIPYSRTIQDHVLKPLRIYSSNNSLLFRGYLRELDWDQDKGLVRLNGPGIGDDLKDSAIERSFSLIRTDEAIRQVWTQDTGFDATVKDQAGDTVVQDETVQEVTAGESFSGLLSGVDPTAPLTDDGTELKPAQTGFFVEGENASGGNGAVSGSDYSNGEAEEVNDIAGDLRFDFTTEHTIPAGEARFAFRVNATDGMHPAFDIVLAGETVESVLLDAYTSGLQWRTTPGRSSELSPGSHQAEIDVTQSSTSPLVVDAMYVYDGRYSPTFDNSVDANGYLSGPGLYPDQLSPQVSKDVLAFPEEDLDYNVEQATVDITMIQGPSADWLQARLNGGPWYPQDGSEQNTTSIATGFGGDIGTRLQSVIDIGATSATRATASPTENYQPEAIEQYRMAYDGNDVSIIEDQTYRGSPLSILTDLHEKAGFRFVIDHAATDNQGNLIKQVESFETGAITKAKDWTVVNRSPRLSFVDYANEVTVYGKLADDGTRPKATVEDTDEVNAYGREPYFEVLPDLTMVEQARYAAVDILSKKVEAREQRGTVSSLPTTTLPGYSYPVDWFADGSPTETPLERVQFQEGTDQLRGRLKFVQDDDVTGTVIDQGRAIDRTRKGI
jgi:hypothetical protein